MKGIRKARPLRGPHKTTLRANCSPHENMGKMGLHVYQTQVVTKLKRGHNKEGGSGRGGIPQPKSIIKIKENAYAANLRSP